MGMLRRLWAPRSRWVVLSGLWLAVAALGWWGMAGKSPPGTPYSTWDRVYAVPDLFSLGFANDYAALDWRIQAARFLGPLVTASTFLQASALIFREQVDRVRGRLARDHVVVCGLGEKGLRLAGSFREAGRRVVAVEADGQSAAVAAARSRGAAVVLGDAADPAVLRQAGVARAAEVVAVCDDATNARIAALVRTADRPPGAPSLHCAVHLRDPQLCHLLRSEALEDATDRVRLEFFNVEQRAARAWLAAEPVLSPPDGRPPYLVVLGVGPLGQNVVVAAGQRWADEAAGGDRLPIVLVDPEAGGRLQALRLRHPSLATFCDVTAVDLDLDRPAPDAVDSFTELLGSGRVTAVLVCLEDEAAALSAALSVRQVLGARPATVLVRTTTEAGLGVLLDVGRSAVPVRAFSPLDRTCTAEAVAGGTHEQVARAFHEDYLARARRDGVGGVAVVPWEELPDGLRESNRRAAAGLAGGLHEVDLDLIPLYRWDDAGQHLTEDEVEALARREHERWAEERRRDGWRWGERRDDAARTNPLLVPWDELSEADRERNRQAVRELPATLARAGFDIVRGG